MFNENDTREDRVNALMDMIDDVREDLEYADEVEKAKLCEQLIILSDMLAQYK